MQIPGVFLWVVLSAQAVAECGLPQAELVKVRRVYDGDTLKLVNGNSVRLLGVNAPEVTRGSKAGQPLGRDAQAAAKAFIAAANYQVRLAADRQERDHYGRLLAHVYAPDGRSLGAHLLRSGMAVHITVPPNIEHAYCLLQIERNARRTDEGIWNSAYWQPVPAASLGSQDTGFRLIRGRVTRVSIKKSIVLELDSNITVTVAKRDYRYFPGYKNWQWLALKGKTVEVRGWLRKPKQIRHAEQSHTLLVLSLRSATAIEIIND